MSCRNIILISLKCNLLRNRKIEEIITLSKSRLEQGWVQGLSIEIERHMFLDTDAMAPAIAAPTDAPRIVAVILRRTKATRRTLDDHAADLLVDGTRHAHNLVAWLCG